MKIAPFCPTLPKNPSLQFFKNLRDQPPSKIGWKGFKTQKRPSLVVYHIQTPLDSYHGIIALTSREDFANLHVLPHEKTLVKREKATLARLQKNRGMYKPILVTYPQHDEINEQSRLFAIENEPDFVYEDPLSKSRHVLWLVKEGSLIKSFKHLFRSVPFCYLADGHHRAKSMLRWPSSKQRPQHILTAYFDLDEVRVSPYNRLILNGLRKVRDLEQALSRYVKILDRGRTPPRQKGTFLVVTNHATWLCAWRKSVLNQAIKSNPHLLDTYLLNEYVLKKVLGLKKIRSNKSIEYIEGQGGVTRMSQKVAESQDHLGFCLYPILEEDFVGCSHGSLMLPPKSTWFRPRLTGGLICQRF